MHIYLWLFKLLLHIALILKIIIYVTQTAQSSLENILQYRNIAFSRFISMDV